MLSNIFFRVNELYLLAHPSFCGSSTAWEELYLGKPFGEASSAAPLNGWAP
jgi:hypothetical protein